MDSSNIPKRDAFMRLNYIYQAAHTMLKINPKNTKLIQFYGSVFNSISRKNVIRVSPDIKRTWCKKCHALMVPGVTSTVRIRDSKRKRKVEKCLNCDNCKKFPINPNYQLWFEHDKSEAAPAPKKNNIQQSKKSKQPAESKISSNGEHKPEMNLNNP